MDRKIHSGIMLVLLLISILTLTFNIQLVKASGTIYIRPDGTIDPPTAPIERDGDFYRLTANIVSEGHAIEIERDNMMLDGDGHILQGGGSGIFLWGRRNVTVKNLNIEGFVFGIYMRSSYSNTISRNNITGGGYYLTHGIWVDGGASNVISGNNITNYEIGIEFLGYSNNNNISANNIAATLTHACMLRYSSGNDILDNNIMASQYSGISMGLSSNYNNICGNSIVNSEVGIFVAMCSNNAIFHNNFVGNIEQVFSYSANNAWDDGYPSGGNYWSNYEERYPDAEELDGSGIWDTPYETDWNDQDNYPLMKPWAPAPPIPTTIGELNSEIMELGSGGEIDNQGIVTSLLAKLDAAQKLIDEGKIDQAKNLLNAFINEVQAQSGKHITPEAAELLIQSAEHILSTL